MCVSKVRIYIMYKKLEIEKKVFFCTSSSSTFMNIFFVCLHFWISHTRMKHQIPRSSFICCRLYKYLIAYRKSVVVKKCKSFIYFLITHHWLIDWLSENSLVYFNNKRASYVRHHKHALLLCIFGMIKCISLHILLREMFKCCHCNLNIVY